MNRSRRAVLAALCVLALALGAATLDNPVADDGGLGGVGSGGFSDAPTHDDGGGGVENGTRDLGAAIPISGACIPFFTSGTFYLLVLALSLTVGTIAYRRGGLLLVLAVFGAVFAPGLVLWMLVTTCGSEVSMSRRAQNFSLFPGQNGTFSTGPGGGGGPGSSVPSLATTVLLVLGVVVVAVALLVLRASDDDIVETADDTTEPDDPQEPLAGLAGVAGDAADRIESGGGETENEVYRAWRDMTGMLDVPNPRTATPAEFREAAREAGMSERHVSLLTDLFRDVRYGGVEPSEDHESRAIEALRAIEDAYGTADDGLGGAGA